MKLTREQVEAMLALRPGPLEVRKGKHGWRVVNQAGDAELGDWNLAECWWKPDADAFAALHDLARELLAAWDREAKLREAVLNLLYAGEFRKGDEDVKDARAALGDTP